MALTPPDKNIKGLSEKWRNWVSQLSVGTCIYCFKMHGKIFSENDNIEKMIPVHERCACKAEPMREKTAGTATNQGQNGADWFLAYLGALPDYYITKQEAVAAGWISWQGNLSSAAPDKMIGGDIFQNRDGKLPSSSGRIWYEADLDYSSGYRNSIRILYSSDGLIFVSYDHYQTFYEIIAL